MIVRGVTIHSSNNAVWHRLRSCLSAAKPKYTFDFSEEEGEENGDDHVTSSPVRLFKDDFASSDTKNRFDDQNNDDEDDDDNEDSFSPTKQKTM